MEKEDYLQCVWRVGHEVNASLAMSLKNVPWPFTDHHGINKYLLKIHLITAEPKGIWFAGSRLLCSLVRLLKKLPLRCRLGDDAEGGVVRSYLFDFARLRTVCRKLLLVSRCVISVNKHELGMVNKIRNGQRNL